MPDVVVHQAIADRALERLAPELRRLIRPEIFRYAVMAPDVFFAYRFFAPHFRRGVHRRSNRIHDARAATFLVELAKRSQRPEAFSFLCGWLCHYAADATLHPRVNALRGDRDEMHMAVEHRLEVLALKRQGKANRDIMRLFPPCPDVPEAGQATLAAFGWNDGLDRVAYRHMVFQYWLFKDQHGLLDRLLGRTRGRLAAMSYRTRLADGLDLSPFDALEAEAAARAAEMIVAAWRYRAGEITAEALEAVIGNRTYAGVEAE